FAPDGTGALGSNGVAHTSAFDDDLFTAFSGVENVSQPLTHLRARVSLHMYIVQPEGAARIRPGAALSPCCAVAIDSVVVPADPRTGTIRDDGMTVADFDGVLEHRCRPVDVFEPVTCRRRGQQVRTELRIQMRRHLDAGGLRQRG